VTGEEVRNLDSAELDLKHREAREQLFRLRFQMTMGQTDGIKKYRAMRKDLARILTVQEERAKAAR
jgi:large subunit ribosomal protein L29